MLQSIRDYTKGRLKTLIVGFIIISFGLWGIHSYLNNAAQPANVVAIVNDQSILQLELNATYERFKQQKFQFDVDVDNDQKLTERLKKEALDQLILAKILSINAITEGYRISTPELNTVLLQMPAFQEGGRFSPNRFKIMLNANFYDEKTFLNDLKTAMLINQSKEGLIDSAFALPGDVEVATKLINQKRDFSYTIIPVTRFNKDIKIKEAAALAYYKQNNARFVEPETVSVKYIQLSLTELASKIHISEAQLKDFYKNNLNDYINLQRKKRPELFLFNQVRNQIKKTLIQQQAEKIFSEQSEALAKLTYTDPTSLNEIAKTLNLPINISPFFDKQGNPKNKITSHPKVIAAAFSQEVLEGNNSDIIEIKPDTLLVLRINQHKPAGIKSFSEVRTLIIQLLKKEEAEKQANAFAKELVQALNHANSGKYIAKNTALKWDTVTNAARYDRKTPTVILNAAFRISHADKGPWNTSFKLANGNYVVLSVTAVHEGQFNNMIENQRRAYTRELESNFGRFDYALHVRNLVNRAKVTIYNKPA